MKNESGVSAKEEQEKRVQRIWKALITQRPVKARKKI
jgi:hypothetical protein